ncbi:MAG: hypothetical protein M9950_09260 [Thermomicrobiales bacterium]|nr:hypothetical protein [Thermomicrobiales bacterium]
MAYRFLLEVPDALYAQANAVITAAPDADINDVHNGIAGHFDLGGKTITLSAHSLDIVTRLDAWMQDVRAHGDQSTATYYLTDGRRLTVGETPVEDIVAAIRRDQPWVERFIPKIGDHATRTGPEGTVAAAVATAEARAAGVAVVNAPKIGNITILATDEPTNHPVIDIDDTKLLHLPVIDLARPERAYGEVFGAAVVSRADRDGRGGWKWLGVSYDTEQEAQFGSEPDYAFVQNGPLLLALERMGRAYPLDVFIKIPAPIRLLVTDESFDAIKANVLVRNWNVFDDSTQGVFGFRDPFGYTWSIHSESFEKDA